MNTVKRFITVMLCAILMLTPCVSAMADTETSMSDTGSVMSYRNGSSMTTVGSVGDGAMSYSHTTENINYNIGLTHGFSEGSGYSVSIPNGSGYSGYSYSIAEKMQEYAFVDPAAYEKYINGGSGITYNESTGAPMLNSVQIGNTEIGTDSRNTKKRTGTYWTVEYKENQTDPNPIGFTEEYLEEHSEVRTYGYFGSYTGWLDDGMNRTASYTMGEYYSKNGSLVCGTEESPAREKIGSNYFYFDQYGRKLKNAFIHWTSFFNTANYALNESGIMITSQFVRVWDESESSSLDIGNGWKWLYCGSNGEIYTDKMFTKGNWKFYAKKDSGQLSEGYTKVNGKIYIFYPEGPESVDFSSDTSFRRENYIYTHYAVTGGWILDESYSGNTWYYADDNGKLCTGRKNIEVNGTTYSCEFNQYGTLMTYQGTMDMLYRDGLLEPVLVF